MNLIELVTELRRLRVVLLLDNGRLRIHAPKGAVPESLRVCAKRHRAAIEDMVQQQEALRGTI